MGTFAETAIFDYHLLSANQGKQTTLFLLQKTNGSGRIPFVLFSVCIDTVYINVLKLQHCFNIYGKQKMVAKVIFCNAFTICSSSKRKFVVCLFVVKGTNGSYPFANRLNGLAHLSSLAI